MSSDTGVAIAALLLLVIILPLSLSAGEYFRNKKLNQSVVQFAYKPLRDMSLWWTLVQTSFGLALVAGAVNTTIEHSAEPAILMVDIPMLLVAWRCFPAICLWWTYWQWDGRACLCFDRAKKEMTYTHRAINFTFAVSEIERLVQYAPAATRAASADYSYAIMHLADTRELLVTSLLCDTIDWLPILPAIKLEVVNQRFAWLPTNPKFRKFFSPFSKYQVEEKE